MRQNRIIVLFAAGCAAAAIVGLPARAFERQAASASTTRSLAERLGHAATDRLLIVNADDVAMSHAANAATIHGMRDGLISSGSIMVPCPWFEEIAAWARATPTADLGLHLTHTSEWKVYKWGPVAGRAAVPGLVTPHGYLWPDVEGVYAHATPQEAEAEARAQIRKALDAGIDVTHLDSHMGALQYDMRFHQVYRRLAAEFDLPIRMGNQDLLAQMGVGHLRAELDADGTIYPDYLVHQQRQPGEAVDVYWRRVLSSLKPGVTELYIHPALAGDEMRHITNSWQERDTEYHLFTDDPGIRALVQQQGITVIGWRPLRDLQRR
jgi:chitin disaccharide deacetylase